MGLGKPQRDFGDYLGPCIRSLNRDLVSAGLRSMPKTLYDLGIQECHNCQGKRCLERNSDIELASGSLRYRIRIYGFRFRVWGSGLRA